MAKTFTAQTLPTAYLTPHFAISDDTDVVATVSIPGVNSASEALAHFLAGGDGVYPTIIDGRYMDLGDYTPVRLRVRS